MSVSPLPEGTQPLVAYLVVKNAAKAIDFYKNVLAAEEILRVPGPKNKIMHAELRISGQVLYLCDEMPDVPQKSPKSLGGTPVGLTLYCLDADVVFQRALQAGAKEVRPMEDAFWGDRMGTVLDPFGHEWTFMTRKEQVPLEEVLRRSKELAGAR